MSLRLVQYYFGTKEELLLAGMQHLAARFGERAMTRIKETGAQAGPRDIIAAILTEALPADDERRTFAVLNAAYFALSLTDPALAISPLVRNSNAVIDVVAAQLRAAQAAGDTPADLDPDAEAISLLAMSVGLGTSVLGGQSSAERVQAVIDYHLDRLFPASRPALRRTRLDQPEAVHLETAGCDAGGDRGTDLASQTTSGSSTPSPGAPRVRKPSRTTGSFRSRRQTRTCPARRRNSTEAEFTAGF